MTEYVEAAINAPGDISFTYLVPEELKGSLSLYQRIRVPLGNRKAIAFVTGFPDSSPIVNLKNVSSAFDPMPVLDKNLSGLAFWMAEEYASSLGMCLHAMLPDKLKVFPPSRGSFPNLPERFTDGSGMKSSVRSFELPREKREAEYLDIIKKTAAAGGKAMIILPETELIAGFALKVRDSGVLAVEAHAKLPQGKQYMALAAMQGEGPLCVVASRQGLFLPVRDLRAVILEEENAGSYRSDETPRFLARDVLVERAKRSGFEVILGSYLLSVDTRHRFPPERSECFKPGRITVVAFKNRFRMLSPLAVKPLEDALKQGKNAVLITTRKGYATAVFCDDCGGVIRCSKCGIPLVLHKEDNTLRCGYCGRKNPSPEACPKCKGLLLSGIGDGVERAESEIAELIPGASTARIDTDALKKKSDRAGSKAEFKSGNGRLAVGTHLAIGYLAGMEVGAAVISGIEHIMNRNDFRAVEQGLSFIAKAADTAPASAKLILQVRDSKNPVARAVQGGSVSEFMEIELAQRKDLLYPPFSRLAFVTLSGRTEEELKNVLQIFGASLEKHNGGAVEILGPLELGKTFGEYRSQYLIRSQEGVGILVKAAKSDLFRDKKLRARMPDVNII